MSDVMSEATTAAAVATTAVNAVAAAPDSVIAPEHESRIAKIESIFKDWEPLLLKLATIAEKVAT
jgi:hypothetical protein